jgi:acetylornithine deacetylase/succinyl-diaminopimelate desuccinylase-like protein
LAAKSAPAGCWPDKGTKPDLMIAAGFSYQVVTAHNGCLQMEVTVHGKMAHAAIPATGVDALQACQQASSPRCTHRTRCTKAGHVQVEASPTPT